VVTNASGDTGAAAATPSMARGYGWSIIFMLAMVFSLISFAFYQVVKIIRAESAREKLRSQAPAPPQVHASGE
jgi:hypothetical protein